MIKVCKLVNSRVKGMLTFTFCIYFVILYIIIIITIIENIVILLKNKTQFFLFLMKLKPIHKNILQ